MAIATVSPEDVRVFTSKIWREYPQNHKAMRECPRCMGEWRLSGLGSEHKPKYYPENYEGDCLCGGKLSPSQLRGGF